MSFAAWKHEKRSRHKNRQMYLIKLQGVKKYITLSLTGNNILLSLYSNYSKGLSLGRTKTPIFLCQRRMMGHGVFKIAISSNFFGAFMSHIIR